MSTINRPRAMLLRGGRVSVNMRHVDDNGEVVVVLYSSPDGMTLRNSFAYAAAAAVAYPFHLPLLYESA